MPSFFIDIKIPWWCCITLRWKRYCTLTHRHTLTHTLSLLHTLSSHTHTHKWFSWWWLNLDCTKLAMFRNPFDFFDLISYSFLWNNGIKWLGKKAKMFCYLLWWLQEEIYFVWNNFWNINYTLCKFNKVSIKITTFNLRSTLFISNKNHFEMIASIILKTIE